MTLSNKTRLKQPLNWSFEVEEPRTKCKHGWYECKKCGTSQVKDSLHTTVNGRGKIGQAIDKAKKNGR